MASASTHYDVAVVGGGPAGAATARRLALHGCRVVLLEQSRFDHVRVGESLSPGVQPLLVDLGVWSEFLDLGPLPSHGTRSVWGSSAPSEHSHLITPYGQGWHVDRGRFDEMLAHSAASAGVELRESVHVAACSPDTDGDRFALTTVRDRRHIGRLSADVLIDATGRSAALARRLGATRAVFDRLVGVTTYFNDNLAGEHCYTLVESTADGWWYCAPVSNEHSVAMFMTDSDLAKPLRVPSRWHGTLESARLVAARVGDRLPREHPRTVCALSHRLVRRHDARRWLAVGDAALAVDPISGSGVIRALRTAHDAAATVLEMLSGRNDALADYEARRDDECTRYLSERAAYYAMEQRWPSAHFWQRRQCREQAAEDSLRPVASTA